MSEGADLTHYVDTEKLKEDVAINPADLSGSMVQHAGLYTHYAVQAVRARRQQDRWKAAAEILEAQLDAEYRRKAKEDGEKTTEAEIKSRIANDARMKAVTAKVISAQQVFRLAEVAERAFEHRKDMLLQLARGAQQEAAGQLRVANNRAAQEGSRDAVLGALAKQREGEAQPG